MESYPYKGIQAVDLASGAFAGDLEEMFVVAGAINPSLPPEQQIKVEFYPFLPHRILDAFKGFSKRLGISAPILSRLPEGVTEDKLAKWTQQYQTDIVRFHLPFFTDPPEFRNQMLHGDYFRVVRRSRAKETLISLMIGTVVNNHGIKLAERFGTGVNVHPNGIIGAKRLGKLEAMKKAAAFVLAENSVDCNLFPEDDYYRDTLYDLDALVTKIVEPEDLNGVLYAKDHHRDEEVNLGVDRDYHRILSSTKVKNNLWAIHLTGEDHRLIVPSDSSDREFLIFTADQSFRHSVRAALDIDPNQIARLSTHDKISLLSKTIKGVHRTQQAA